jgi:hypothetical protein
MLDAPRRADAGLRGEPLILRGGPRSSLARQLGHARLWGERLSGKTYLEVVSALLAAADHYKIVRPVGTASDVEGWRLAASAVRLVAGDAVERQWHADVAASAFNSTMRRGRQSSRHVTMKAVPQILQ